MELAYSRSINFCSQRDVSELINFISGSFSMLALNDGVRFADTLPAVLLGHWSRGNDNF